ncbi:MAG: ABC transporter substrate-binding protein [Lachnospiraceae bacterium]|nr:ABC transporter substrate-binding protein [Lachnospiraceae bacterium]
MKKCKILSVLLVLCLSLGLIACGSKESAGNDNAGSTKVENGSKDSAESETTASKDPVTVKVSYPCLVIVPSEDAVVGVEEVINKYLEEKGSGVRLDLEAVDANNYNTTIDMKQIGGDQVDLYMSLGGFADQVNANKVLPITDYVHTALQPTIDITGEEILGATTFNGQIYGMPVYRTDVCTYYWILPTTIAENDLGFEVGKTVTIDELTGYLDVLHQKYPDQIAMAVRPGMNGMPNNFCLSAIMGGPEYYLVTDLGSGVGIEGNNTTVVNLYDTDYFKDVCQTAYDWNQKGYVNKDVSVVAEEGYDLMKAGRALSYIIGYGGCNPQVTDESDTTHGMSVMYVPIAPAINMPSGLNWCVSYGCKNVEAACEALNLFYTDPFVMNSILYGVEGRDYEDTGLGNGEDKIVKLPEGKTMFDVPYYAFFTCGIMGNEYIDWVSLQPDGTYEDRREANKEFQRNAVSSPIYGFTFDTANVKNEVAGISTVESQYLSGLLSGELDPNEYIPKLVQAVKDAGQDAVIAEAQRQIDAWK